MIQSQYSADEYTGDGILATFPFTSRILAKTDLIVYAPTILDLNSDYTIADADVNTANGGNVVFTVPPANGTKIFFHRHTAQTQLNNIEEGSPFPAAVVNKEFDRLTMMIQDVQYQLRQTLSFPPTSGIDDSFLPEPEAGMLIRWNDAETGFENVAASALELTHLVIPQNIPAGATSAIIVHNLGSTSANIVGFTPNWFTGYRQIAQDANTITIEFSTECPPGGGTIKTEVVI